MRSHASHTNSMKLVFLIIISVYVLKFSISSSDSLHRILRKNFENSIVTIIVVFPPFAKNMFTEIVYYV